MAELLYRWLDLYVVTLVIQLVWWLNEWLIRQTASSLPELVKISANVSRCPEMKSWRVGFDF